MVAAGDTAPAPDGTGSIMNCSLSAASDMKPAMAGRDRNRRGDGCRRFREARRKRGALPATAAPRSMRKHQLLGTSPTMAITGDPADLCPGFEAALALSACKAAIFRFALAWFSAKMMLARNC